MTDQQGLELLTGEQVGGVSQEDLPASRDGYSQLLKVRE